MSRRFEPDDLLVKCNTTEGGQLLWIARWRWAINPVGLVFGCVLGSKTFYVGWSYTLPSFRRQGVRAAIHKAMVEWGYQRIVTGGGTTEGGMAWLRAAGYKWDAVGGMWVWTKPGAKRLPVAKAWDPVTLEPVKRARPRRR